VNSAETKSVVRYILFSYIFKLYSCDCKVGEHVIFQVNNYEVTVDTTMYEYVSVY